MKTLAWTAFFVAVFSAAAWASGAGESGSAGSTPGFAVLELFTSEGCSSCPPADEAVAKAVSTAAAEGLPVYLLAWHVDYWDSLGWRDPYDSKPATQRQERYAQLLHTQLFTPELVVNGGTVASHAGDAAEIDRLVRSKLDGHAQASVSLALSQDENGAPEVNARVSRAPEGAVLGLALVEDGLTQTPDAGENSGRRLTHDGVVRWYREYPIPRAAAGVVSARLPVLRGVDPDSSRIVAIVQSPATLSISGAAESALPASDAKASVAGSIVDASGSPLSDASIQVCSDEICLLGRTDASGRFRVENIPPGAYALKFPNPNPATGVGSIDIKLRAGQNLTLQTIHTANTAMESR